MEIIYKNDGKGNHQSHKAHLKISTEKPWLDVDFTGYGYDKKGAFKELKEQFTELKINLDKASKLFEEEIMTPSSTYENQHFADSEVQEILNQIALEAVAGATAALKEEPTLKPSHYNGLFSPLAELQKKQKTVLTGIDSEWHNTGDSGGPGAGNIFQNKLNSAVFKSLRGAWFLDAIHWIERDSTASFTGTVQGISSVQGISFPFIPKTFLVEVVKEQDSPDFTILDAKTLLEARDYGYRSGVRATALNPDHYKAPCSLSTMPIILRLTGKDPTDYDECKDLIKAIEADYFTGAAIKYLWRCQKKGFYVLDLGKAIEHLQERPRSLSRSNIIHEIRGLINA